VIVFVNFVFSTKSVETAAQFQTASLAEKLYSSYKGFASSVFGNLLTKSEACNCCLY